MRVTTITVIYSVIYLFVTQIFCVFILNKNIAAV